MTEDEIISRILRREGSEYTNNLNDRGGATKYGITQRAWDDYVSKDPAHAPTRTVDSLTEPMAREFYRSEYMDKFRWINDPALLDLAVDCAVNHGTMRAIRWLQASVGASVDGVIGPMTMESVNLNADKCYREVLRTRFNHYARLSTSPGQIMFLVGWINRACEFIR